MKYDEGSLVALRAARRLIQSADATDAQVLIVQLCDRWRVDLAAQQARERPSPLWIAYVQGGADALTQLLARGLEDHDG
ncbi:MAG: hypothetical protein HGA45_24230 [Chloroflexales bacterium]|nr:hypothetical protein [Chloroflexales bacterium]